jgi:hypothetical protein
MLGLEVDQATTLLLPLSTPGVVGSLLLHKAGLLGHAGVLLAEEGVVASVTSM